MKRTRWISLGLVLTVLLLPLPASAGSVWEASAEGWGGAWQDLIEWLGPSVLEMSCMLIDPNGCPASATPPASSTTESCAAVDPLGGCHS